jgi:membrane protease YdiL (CAAX protease family)
LQAGKRKTVAHEQGHVAPINLGYSTVLFGAGALLLMLVVRVVIPALGKALQVEPVLLWFGSASVIVFVPLALCGWVLLHRENHLTGWVGRARRMRLRPVSSEDLVWAFGGLAAVGILTAGIVAVLRALRCDAGLHPAFMTIEPLTPGRYWILAVWAPFFLLNILGEEFFWRGIILPRQEAALGSKAWLANGFGWLFFHIAFPWQVLVTLVPTVLLLPYVVQRRGNTWIGVIIHAALNGLGFLALAFGLA